MAGPEIAPDLVPVPVVFAPPDASRFPHAVPVPEAVYQGLCASFVEGASVHSEQACGNANFVCQVAEFLGERETAAWIAANEADYKRGCQAGFRPSTG